MNPTAIFTTAYDFTAPPRRRWIRKTAIVVGVMAAGDMLMAVAAVAYVASGGTGGELLEIYSHVLPSWIPAG